MIKDLSQFRPQVSNKTIIIDRYCASVVETNGILNKKKTAGRKAKKPFYRAALPIKAPYTFAPIKKVTAEALLLARKNTTFMEYNKKSPRTVKKLTQIINLFYESRRKHFTFYWVTLTTVQHKTNKTDSQLYYGVKLWLQHKRVRYVCVAERQRNTGDLHFHLIIEQKDIFKIKEEQNRIADVFGVMSHPALFDVKRIRNVSTLISYLAKYVRKPLPTQAVLQKQFDRQGTKNPSSGKEYKFSPPYSSLFQCRTFSYSGDIGKTYKSEHHRFRIEVSAEIKEDYPYLFKPKYSTEFFTVYDYSIDLWNLCQQYKSKILKIFPLKVLEVPII